ncbi:MAG: metal-dependent hydrolase [Chloroflexota bacterium]
MASATITWLGHAATQIETQGKTILVDPWIKNNPVTPESAKHIGKVDLILISHGHADNMGDVVEIAKQQQPVIMAMNELCGYLSSQGAEHCSGGNTGGSQRWEGARITLTDAIHSSSVEVDGKPQYAGLSVGFMIALPGGPTIYHAGDTALFAGMELLGRLYKPDLALLPIGDYFTMGPPEAAEAIRLLGVKHVIPIHYGTFPVLTGTVDELRRHASDIQGLNIQELKPGESLHLG